MTFNSNIASCKPYNKPNNKPLYVYVESNHPPNLSNRFLNQYLIDCLQILVANLYLIKHQNLMSKYLINVDTRINFHMIIQNITLIEVVISPGTLYGLIHCIIIQLKLKLVKAF